MTQANEPSRLDRIETILEEIAIGLKQVKQITDSNARSIQAGREDFREYRNFARFNDIEWRRRTLDLLQGNVVLHQQIAEIKASISALRDRLERLLGEGDSDAPKS